MTSLKKGPSFFNSMRDALSISFPAGGQLPVMLGHPRSIFRDVDTREAVYFDRVSSDRKARCIAEILTASLLLYVLCESLRAGRRTSSQPSRCSPFQSAALYMLHCYSFHVILSLRPAFH